MKKVFLAIACLVLTNCAKKVEATPTPVNPQITDAVTQAATPPAETLDAGFAGPVLSSDPNPKLVEVPAVSSTPEQK